jgi:hypothetical protein
MVGMMDDRPGLTTSERHREGRQYQLHAQVHREGPSNYPTAPGVQDNRHIQESQLGRHIGDVDHPALIGS